MGARQTYKEEFNELFARTQDLVDGGDERKETIFNRQYTTPYFICILSMNKLEKLLGPYFLIMMKNSLSSIRVFEFNLQLSRLTCIVCRLKANAKGARWIAIGTEGKYFPESHGWQ
jgi:hypothetical protein